jgi:DNA-binding CsgD family transcriptional regulator
MPASSTDPDYPDLGGLLAILFSSLLDAEPWTAFLSTLRKAADASYATVIITPRTADRPGLILTPGADPHVDAEYATRLFAVDPFTGLPEGRVSHFRDFVSDEALARTPAFREFMSSLEVLGVDIVLAERIELRLRLTRDAAAPRFRSTDAARLQRLVPHLRVALAIYDRLAAVETEQRVYAGAVEQMSIGVVIVDAAARALRVNPRAAALLAEADGLRLKDGVVSPSDADLARQLRARLTDMSAAQPLTLRIERPSGRGDLLMVVARAPEPDRMIAGNGPAAVLFLTDPARVGRISADAVRDLLQLTQSEANVAAQLAEGLSPTEVAAQFGISLNTVRAHLRAIFAKTGVRRQGQLVQLIHHSLPALGHPRPGA